MAQVKAANKQGPGFKTLVHNPMFLRLWIAQLISQTIQNSTNFASVILLGTQSGSYTAVGGVIIAFSLPMVLFGIPAGVLVDRINKKTVLWVSNIARALASFGFVISLLINNKAFVPIYILTFFISLIGQFFSPAEGAAIPLLVKKDEIVSALSLFNVTFTISQALGFIIVGPLILQLAPTLLFHHGTELVTFTNIHFLFTLVGFLYIICAILTATLPNVRLQPIVGPNANVDEHRIIQIWRSIVETGDVVRHDRGLVIALTELTLGGTVMAIISMIVPTPNFSQQFLGRPPQAAALFIFLPAGIGLVSGSAVMPRIINRIGSAMAEVLGIIGVSSSIVLIIMVHWIFTHMSPLYWRDSVSYFLLLILLFFLVGLSMVLITLPAQTAMQHRSPDYIKGRVLSLQGMLQNSAQIVIIPLFGALADMFRLPAAMNILAIFTILLGLSCVYIGERRGAYSRPLLKRNAAKLRAIDSMVQQPSFTYEEEHDDESTIQVIGKQRSR